MENKEQTALAPLAELTAVEVFTGDALDLLLNRIEREVMAEEADVTTAKGRKAIASRAHKARKSKVVVDDLRKDLVSEWKDKSKKVDTAGLKARNFLDALYHKARKPLTDWEYEKEREAEEERQRIAAEEAAKIAEFEARRVAEQEKEDAERAAAQKILDDREAAIAKREEEAKQAAEAERIQKEANERAKREAEEQVKKAQEDAARRVAEEKIKAEQAEQARVEAEARAKVEQEQAVQKAKREAEELARRKEQAQIEAAEEKKRADEARQADEDHRRNINRAALSGIMNAGCDEVLAKRIITAIARGMVQNVTVNY